MILLSQPLRNLASNARAQIHALCVLLTFLGLSVFSLPLFYCSFVPFPFDVPLPYSSFQLFSNQPERSGIIIVNILFNVNAKLYFNNYRIDILPRLILHKINPYFTGSYLPITSINIYLISTNASI